MNDSDKTTQHSDSAILRFWQRIPVVIRAIVSGLFVFAMAGSVARMVVLALIFYFFSLQSVCCGGLWPIPLALSYQA